MWMSFSPNGVHWTNCESNPVIPLDSDTTQSLVWDPKIQKYVVFGRFGAGGRKTARAESPDAIQFSEPKRVFECDEIDEEGTQIYGMPINIYEGIYLGMIWIYREGVDGTIDTALATSRDGINWQRVLDRQTFLTLGQHGQLGRRHGASQSEFHHTQQSNLFLLRRCERTTHRQEIQAGRTQTQIHARLSDIAT